MKFVTIFLAVALLPLSAQDIKMPANLDKLAAKAEETVDVTLDSNLLKLAAKFVSGKDPDDVKIQKVISGLQSVVVKSFTFSSAGQYDPADVNAVRAQVSAAPWSRIVGVTSKKDGESVDVYFKDGGNGNLGGVVVLCAEPKELTIVSIMGTLDPSQLADLGGHFGVPELNIGAQLRELRNVK